MPCVGMQPHGGTQSQVERQTSNERGAANLICAARSYEAIVSQLQSTATVPYGG